MPRSRTPNISLEEAKRRFEEWRRNRRGKASIPDELWAAAVEVARREGVSRTSTELRVEWNHLKRRMAVASGASPNDASPTFVELAAARPQPFPECTIELEGRRGNLRIQLKGASTFELTTLTRSLWEAAS
ncbi:MAG TPA: hypothetical protein VNH18_14235 [Bryobacteraceae bacterium]|nr:hypothetical protein [Bryobacteraceae bacterium]HXJ40436.1 hypothetical protein [Bryobacteraceae bacterium]